MADLLAQYEEYLATEKHASQNTLSSYMRDLHQFAVYLDEFHPMPLPQVTQEVISGYVAGMGGKGKSAATITRSIASIKSLYTYLQMTGEVSANPAKGVAAVKVEHKFPEILTGKEVELFLDQPQCVDAKGYRDHAMLELLYATGIRVSELRHITAEAVREGRAAVRNKGKTRVILIPAALRKLLLGYMKKAGVTTGSVFLSKNKTPLDRSTVWRRMKALCERAGVDPRKVFPHSLRHLFARVFYSVEKDLLRLADILGHASVNTTRIYTMETGRQHMKLLERVSRTLLT